MTRLPRLNHNPAFKEEMALAAISGEQKVVQFSHQFDVHVNRISHWNDRFLEGRQAFRR